MEDITSEFERAASVDEREKLDIIQTLAHRPDETLKWAVAMLKGPEKRFWKTAVQAIQAVGYPQNASTLPVLFEQLSDRNSPAWREVVQTLSKIGPQVVSPYMIAVLLERHRQRYWIDAIAGICTMLTLVESEYARPCGPAVSYLLSQGQLRDEFEELERDYLLDVLERIGPSCAVYAVPVLIALVKTEGISEISKQARRLLASFDQAALEPYQYLLADL